METVPPQPFNPPARSREVVRPRRRTAILKRGLSLVALAGLVAWSIYLASQTPTKEELSLAELRPGQFKTLDHIRLEGVRVARAALHIAIAFAPLGLLLAFAFGGWLQTNRRRRTLALGIGIAALALCLTRYRPFVLPLGLWPNYAPAAASALLSLWIGAHLARGRRGVFALAGKTILLALALVGTTVALAWFTFAAGPPTLQATKLNSAEKRRLFEFFKERTPSKIPPGETRSLVLDERDLDLLFAWWLSIDESVHVARFSLEEGLAAIEVELAATGPDGGTWHMPISAAGSLTVRDGRMELNVQSARVGRIELPASVVDRLADRALQLLQSHEKVRPVIECMHSLEIHADGVRVVYGYADLDLAELASTGVDELSTELQAAIDAQVRRLLDVAQTTSPRQPDAASRAMIQAAFALAAERSKTGDAVVQNRAALVAVGAVLGYPGFSPPESIAPGGLTPRQRKVLEAASLRGRVDWRRHFTISAALAAAGGRKLSDAIGLFKEELDAGNGGSGFSFGDLLADRAGARFGAAAVSSEGAARSIQTRLGEGAAIEDFFPAASDLPEGIPDAQLSAEYGGVGGERYRAIVDDIDRRIKAAPGYR